MDACFQLQVLAEEFSVCKVASVPDAVYATGTYFIGQTDEETSLVCESSCAPDDALEREDGWRAMRIVGVLDFSLVGILASIAGTLAEAGVGIFAVSTFNTDYILVKADALGRAMAALEAAGHTFRPDGVAERNTDADPHADMNGEASPDDDAPYCVLGCVADVSERTWALIECDEPSKGSFQIADVTDGETRIVGYYDGSTGDVFAGDEPGTEGNPAVHVIGSLDGDTGQVTVRQPAGNYLRICRWDRLDPSLHVDALLRTLPQCGCGGSLGAPKLFDSFAEMSAYHFCAFYL